MSLRVSDHLTSAGREDTLVCNKETNDQGPARFEIGEAIHTMEPVQTPKHVEIDMTDCIPSNSGNGDVCMFN